MGAISLYARPSPDFAQKLSHSLTLLESSVADFSPLTQASSLDAEDMVVTHLMYEADICAGLFVLETEMLPEETMALVDRLEARYQRRVSLFRPDADAAAALVQTCNSDPMLPSLALPDQNCVSHKIDALARALSSKKGWITGLRREQSDARADVPYVQHQSGRAKINPLADWTLGDVWHYISINDIPYNPVHHPLYSKVCCEPCPRVVTAGENIRSGRWWWKNEYAKEFSVRVTATGSVERPHAAHLGTG